VIHVVGQTLWDRSTRSAMCIDERPAGKGPNPKEMPNLVKTLPRGLGEYEKGSDCQRQDEIEGWELPQLAGDLLGSCTDSHWAGFPVIGGP
jgi:hypothetical protein